MGYGPSVTARRRVMAVPDDFRKFTALAEVARELTGDDIEPEELQRRLARMIRGTDAEYHFAALAVWGGATLVQRIDDSHWTDGAKEMFKVPDIWLVVRDADDKLHPCWVEVKSSQSDSTLRITGPYHERMRAFRELTGHPYLVAFRNNWGLWTLVDIDMFDPGSFRIGLNEMRENLMGLLLSDALVVVPQGAGMTIKMRRLGEQSGETETGWSEAVRLEDVYPHRSDRTRVEDPVPWLDYVFFMVEEDTRTEIRGDEVIEEFFAPSDSTVMMQTVLSSRAGFAIPDEDDIDWRSIVERAKDFPSAREIVGQLSSSGFVSHVVRLIPSTIPPNFQSFDPRSARAAADGDS